MVTVFSVDSAGLAEDADVLRYFVRMVVATVPICRARSDMVILFLMPATYHPLFQLCIALLQLCITLLQFRITLFQLPAPFPTYLMYI